MLIYIIHTDEDRDDGCQSIIPSYFKVYSLFSFIIVGYYEKKSLILIFACK